MSDGQDGDSTGIFGQRFDANGTQIGLQVPTPTPPPSPTPTPVLAPSPTPTPTPTSGVSSSSEVFTEKTEETTSPSSTISESADPGETRVSAGDEVSTFMVGKFLLLWWV